MFDSPVAEHHKYQNRRVLARLSAQILTLHERQAYNADEGFVNSRLLFLGQIDFGYDHIGHMIGKTR